MAHLLGLELDAVGRGQKAARHVDHVDQQRLARVDRVVAAADRCRVRLEFEGIEGGKLVGVFGNVSGEAGDNS
jgi:hypothetical protein